MSDEVTTEPKTDDEKPCTDNPVEVDSVKDPDTDGNNTEFIFFFNTKKQQVIFEFFYLLLTFIVAGLHVFWLSTGRINVPPMTKLYLYSFLGGFLGGWTFDTKWFYRVTAMGKDNQYKWKWEAKKIYWRILIPPFSGALAFGTYAILSANILPFHLFNARSGLTAFGCSYLIGCFSDTAFGWIAQLSNSMLQGEQRNAQL